MGDGALGFGPCSQEGMLGVGALVDAGGKAVPAAGEDLSLLVLPPHAYSFSWLSLLLFIPHPGYPFWLFLLLDIPSSLYSFSWLLLLLVIPTPLYSSSCLFLLLAIPAPGYPSSYFIPPLYPSSCFIPPPGYPSSCFIPQEQTRPLSTGGAANSPRIAGQAAAPQLGINPARSG